MSAEPRWFVAEAVLQCTLHTGHGDQKRHLEDLVFLVQDIDEPSAIAKAERIAKEKEHSYEKAKGEHVFWSLFGSLKSKKQLISGSKMEPR